MDNIEDLNNKTLKELNATKYNAIDELMTDAYNCNVEATQSIEDILDNQNDLTKEEIIEILKEEQRQLHNIVDRNLMEGMDIAIALNNINKFAAKHNYSDTDKLGELVALAKLSGVNLMDADTKID